MGEPEHRDGVASLSLQQFAAVCFMFIGGGIALMGVMVFFRQVHGWLRTGTWKGHSALEAMELFGYAGWAEHPTDWLGLHRLLGNTPLSLLALVVGLSILVYAVTEYREAPFVNSAPRAPASAGWRRCLKCRHAWADFKVDTPCPRCGHTETESPFPSP
jgi:hypothetical protein